MSLIVATRYARAWMNTLLKSVSNTELVLEKARLDALLIADTLKNISLSITLASPVLPAEHKQKIVHDLFHKHLQTLSLQFLHLIIYKKRGKLLKEIITQFLFLVQMQQGITPITITTVVPLDLSNQTILEQSLKKKYNKIAATYLQDHRIIGGLVLNIHSLEFNISVKRKLERLKKALIQH